MKGPQISHSSSPRGQQTKETQPSQAKSNHIHLALRANPFPEVTDPFCRLPLPTLFHWPEAVHLGDLMRLWVRPIIRATIHLNFQGPMPLHRILQKIAILYQTSMLLADWIDSKHQLSVNKKRKLFPGITGMSWDSNTLPFTQLIRSGILTWFPFDKRFSIKKKPFNGFHLSLRID